MLLALFLTARTAGVHHHVGFMRCLGTKPTVSRIVGNHSTNWAKAPLFWIPFSRVLLVSEDKCEQMMAGVVGGMGGDKGKVKEGKREMKPALLHPLRSLLLPLLSRSCQGTSWGHGGGRWRKKKDRSSFWYWISWVTCWWNHDSIADFLPILVKVSMFLKIPCMLHRPSRFSCWELSDLGLETLRISYC